jgi:lactoylglutathione lyase
MRKILVVVVVGSLLLFGASYAHSEGWLATAKDVDFVAKVDVSNLKASTEWYVDKIGLVRNARFDAPTWRQLDLPGKPGVSIGLNLNAKGVGSGGATATFVVADIEKERQALISKGVNVTPISNVGDGVCLAFFKDPDGNQLGLRKNGCKLAAGK